MPLFDLDDLVPFLTSDGVRVQWTSGWDALLAAASRCIRVNARGVSSKPMHWTAIDLHTSTEWVSRPCPFSATGLCDTGSGVCFPETHAIYDPLASWGGLQCSRAHDGRSLISVNTYDLTSCDVLDTGGDLVLCNGHLSFSRTEVAKWIYWAVCLIAVYIIRSLSYLVIRRISDKKETNKVLVEPPLVLATDKQVSPYITTDDYTVGASVLGTLLTLFSGWIHVLVTLEEAFIAVFTLVYVAIYTLLWIWTRSNQHEWTDPPIYNLIAGTLHFMSMRLYTGVETPYTPLLIWAIGTRICTKLRTPTCIATYVTVPLDAILLALLCAFAFQHDVLFLLATGAACLITSDIM